LAYLLPWAPIVSLLAVAMLAVASRAADLPPIGEWDGVTASATLDGPYEDPTQAAVPFGIISYFKLPWRAYLDTWPASQFQLFCGTQWNTDSRFAEALCQVLQESGIRAIRYEIGWGNLDWDDALPEGMRARMARDFAVFKRHGLRPLILLNAHHGQPCPVRGVDVELAAAAVKGDRALKLKDGTGIRVGYTGPAHPDYIAACPLITAVDGDGTAHLSAPLPMDLPAGPLRLIELKYRPFQGVLRKDGTPAPEAAETFAAWVRYAAAVGQAAREALGTEGQRDAGFDIEVWNEQTFGSNFLDINRYYAEKIEYAEPFVYRRTRPMQDGYRPDARLEFEQDGCYAILPMTIDYFQDPANGFPGVEVISGFANQWPWDNGTGLWHGQAGFSRHYYTGGWQDCSPETPLGNKASGVVNALGEFEGRKDGKDWHTVEPGSYFVPTFRLACPEFFHTGFKTEMITRDVIPDSRWSHFKGHGRYTHNGDFRRARVWQTEVNYDRNAFFGAVFAAAGVPRDDPRALALAQRLAGKTFLRQYLFHAHKGLYRVFLFSPQPDPYGIGLLPQAFYDAVATNGYALGDEARRAVPPEFKGLGWFVGLLDGADSIEVTRACGVRKLVEHRPRLALAGDGTPAHPHRWHRDLFAFMPYQLAANRYAIPYYVATLDVTRAWAPDRDVLDPARYDMPEQEFDVTIGNLRGLGATVTAYDLLTHQAVPVEALAATPDTLTVRLRAVDYPRVLQVTESAPGILILAPEVARTADGGLAVHWRQNLPAERARVSHGPDWTRRDETVIELAPGAREYSTVIPAADLTGVPAVRIRVAAGGLEAVWPRWDEEPAGQAPMANSGSAKGNNTP